MNDGEKQISKELRRWFRNAESGSTYYNDKCRGVGYRMKAEDVTYNDYKRLEVLVIDLQRKLDVNIKFVVEFQLWESRYHMLSSAGEGRRTVRVFYSNSDSEKMNGDRMEQYKEMQELREKLQKDLKEVTCE